MTKLTFYSATEQINGSICTIKTISSCVFLEPGLLQLTRPGETSTCRSNNSRQQGDI